MTLIEHEVLAPRISEILPRIDVDGEGLSASLDGVIVTGDSVKTLTARLASMLYRVVHAGQPHEISSTANHPQRYAGRLAESVPHQWTRRNAQILEANDGAAVVELDGVRVRVMKDRLCPPHQVLISAARPALSPGFFLVDGSTMLPSEGAVVRIYVHAGATAAIEAWLHALRYLEHHEIPYRAKVISDPASLPRRDSLVIYLSSLSMEWVPGLVATLARIPDFLPDVSPFTREVTTGVALAWEPMDPRSSNVSLGEHRSQALATGLVRHAVSIGGGDRTMAVRRAFIESMIDPLDPARNLDSPSW
ncbi:hypothetical protein GCM10027589_13240 [Actinocorallia lasiicapitis]